MLLLRTFATVIGVIFGYEQQRERNIILFSAILGSLLNNTAILFSRISQIERT
jgi:hypothetical protein